MKSHFLSRAGLTGVLFLVTTYCTAQDKQTEFIGAWAFVLPDGNPAWLKLTDAGSQFEGSLLWSVGSARPVKSVQIENSTLAFERKLSWRPYFGAYGEFGNLITERLFADFELTIEYNVPPGGNSGVYLRGMYETQVVDRDSRM